MRTEVSINKPSERIASVDALRGFVMFVMIFVNDLALVKGRLVPDWMVHFSDRAKGNGMTFVDLVLPAFIFIVGMSIPFAMRASLLRGKTHAQIVGHVLIRTCSLLLLGVIFVGGWPGSDHMGWSAALWQTLAVISATLAFCEISPPKHTLPSVHSLWRGVTAVLRILGLMGLVILAFLYVGKQGGHIITLHPLHLYTSWWGILGIIGWAYLIASVIYLFFHHHSTALLGCMALLLCLFPAARVGILHGVWLADYINIGATLGTQPAIAVAGMLLSSMLITPDTNTVQKRIQFTVLYVTAMMLGAILLYGLYGLSKNQATPSWALSACAITASFWLIFYMMCDVKPTPFRWISKPLTLAGNNVLLANLLSALYFSFIINIGLGDWYKAVGQMDLLHAVLRALSVSVILLSCTVGLNRFGFRLKL